MPAGRFALKYRYITTHAEAMTNTSQMHAKVGRLSLKKNNGQSTLKNIWIKYKIKFIFLSVDFISLSRHIKKVDTPIAMYIIDQQIGNTILGAVAGGIL